MSNTTKYKLVQTTTTIAAPGGGTKTITKTVVTPLADVARASASAPAAQGAAEALPAPIILEMNKTQTDLLNIMGGVSGLNLVSNWDDSKMAALTAAFATLLELNPLLTGGIVMGDNGLSVCKSGLHTMETIMQVFDAPDSFTFPANGLHEQLDAVYTQAFPLIAGRQVAPGMVLLETGDPVTYLNVLPLPGGMCLIDFQISHFIADGATYYRLSGNLTDLMAGKVPAPNKWDAPPPHAMLEPKYTDNDTLNINVNWVPLFVEKMGPLLEPGGARPREIVVVDQDALKELKKEYMAAPANPAVKNDAEFLSSNDLVTAGVMEISNCKIAAMAMNMRNRSEGCKADNLGNFERLTAFANVDIANNPKYLRGKVLVDHYGYEPGTVPDSSDMDLVAITNWHGLSQYIVPPGSNTLLHCPGPIADTFPLDLAIIFKPTEGLMAVYHNWKDRPETSGLVANSKLFKRWAKQNSAASSVV